MPFTLRPAPTPAHSSAAGVYAGALLPRPAHSPEPRAAHVPTRMAPSPGPLSLLPPFLIHSIRNGGHPLMLVNDQIEPILIVTVFCPQGFISFWVDLHRLPFY